MGLSWQQGPLGTKPAGRFLLPEPLPARLLFAEPLRRRMRVRFGGAWIADSEDVILLHEPGHYPVAFFPVADIRKDSLTRTDRVTHHPEFGATAWFTVHAGQDQAGRAAWQYTELPEYAAELRDRVAFAWRAMEAFYEEDERIVGHVADSYHRKVVRLWPRLRQRSSTTSVPARAQQISTSPLPGRSNGSSMYSTSPDNTAVTHV